MNDRDTLQLKPSIDNPDRPAHFSPQLTAVNHNSGKTVARIRHLQALTDEPSAKGGEDSAPTPLETVLLALVGCEGVVIRNVAKAMRFQLEKSEFECSAVSDLRGARGVRGVRPHFESLRLLIKIYSSETEQRMEKLRFNVEQRCPVLNLLDDAGVSLDVRWQLVENTP